MQAIASQVNRMVVPAVGDMYAHPTGQYEVDWVCGCGDYDDGETCIGLCGESMTWTGTVAELAASGFVRHNGEITCER